jgi:hypothetical protein
MIYVWIISNGRECCGRAGATAISILTFSRFESTFWYPDDFCFVIEPLLSRLTPIIAVARRVTVMIGGHRVIIFRSLPQDLSAGVPGSR